MKKLEHTIEIINAYVKDTYGEYVIEYKIDDTFVRYFFNEYLYNKILRAKNLPIRKFNPLKIIQNLYHG